MQVQALNLDRAFPFGPAVVVTAETGEPPPPAEPPVLTLMGVESTGGNQFEIRFHADGPAGAFILARADAPDGVYTDSGLVAVDIGGGEFKFVVTIPSESRMFYRVEATAP